MLSVVLTVLKILGIILLSLIGLVLLILLLVLFVPLRYRVFATKKEGDEAPVNLKARVTWLFWLLNVHYLYPEEDPLRIRIAFFRIGNKDDGEAEGEEEDGRKKKKKKKEEKEEKDRDKDKKEKKKKKGEKEEESEEPVSAEEEEGFSEDDEKEQDLFDTVTDFAEEAADTINEEVFEEDPTLKGFIDKVFSFLRKIKFQIVSICDKIKDVCDRIAYYAEVLSSDYFAKALSLTKKETGKLLWSIRPRRIRGHLDFGGETPDAAGRVFSWYAMAYPWIGKQFVFVPHFEEKILDGEIDLKGRITIFTILWIAARLYFNRDIKKSLKMLKKEA